MEIDEQLSSPLQIEVEFSLDFPSGRKPQRANDSFALGASLDARQ